jgi:DNA-directed RNA polymerase specialized sigma24 family protein
MAGRDEAEFEAYVANDGGRLLGFAMLLAGNYQDAEDLVQTALLRSAGRWVAARQNPTAYTRTVLVNLARDRWRARRHRQRETLIADTARLTVTTAHDGAAAVLDRQVLLRARPPVLGGPVDRGDGGRAGVQPGHREITHPPRAAAAARGA